MLIANRTRYNTELGFDEDMSEREYSEYTDSELEVEFLVQKLRTLELEAERVRRTLGRKDKGDTGRSYWNDCGTSVHNKEACPTELRTTVERQNRNQVGTTVYLGQVDRNEKPIYRGNYVQVLTSTKSKTAKFYGVELAEVTGVDKKRDWIELVSIKNRKKVGFRAPTSISVLAQDRSDYLNKVQNKEIEDIGKHSN